MRMVRAWTGRRVDGWQQWGEEARGLSQVWVVEGEALGREWMGLAANQGIARKRFAGRRAEERGQ